MIAKISAHAALPPPDNAIERDVVHRIENIFRRVGVCFFQTGDQLFHFPALSVFRFVAHTLGKTARAAQKGQSVVLRPGDNVAFAHAV